MLSYLQFTASLKGIDDLCLQNPSCLSKNHAPLLRCFCFVLFYIALFSCFIALKATLLLNTCLASGCHCSYLLVLLYRCIHSRKAVFFLVHIITVFFYCPLSFCHLIISIWIADVSLSFKSQSDDIQLVHSHEMIEI